MTYTQTVTPDLNVVGNVGWCLSMQEDVWGTPHSYATATDAWQATEFPHTDRDFPNVAVLVWFSYYEGGENYGHVVTRTPDGRLLSSPYKKDGTQVWFDNIAQCETVLDCTYIGWSEDIAGIRVAQPQGGTETVDGVNKVAASPKEIDDTINQIRIALGYPNSKLDDMLNTYRDLLKNNYVSGVMTMLNNLITDPARPTSQAAAYVPYSGPQLFIKK